MGVRTVRDPAVEQALVRSLLYEVLAVGFAYPEEGAVERLRGLLARTREVVTGPDLARPLAKLGPVLEAVDRLELEARHNALFSGSVSCSPHETEYEADPFAKVRQLADVSGFYRAFGLGVSEARRTMPDFIGTELEFMSLLCRKEAYAASRGWAERAGVAAAAERDFLRDHLGRWVAAFCGGVRRETADRPGAAAFYRALAELCERFVEAEIAAFGVSPVRLERQMTAASDAEPAACGLDPGAARPT